MLKLNLGGGNKRIEGFTNVDLDPQCEVNADLRELPYADNSVDEAIAVHVIEHFYHWEVQDLLAEWRRVLKPGAKLILECPNLDSLARAMLSPFEVPDQYHMWGLYGDPKHKNPLMCHKWGYTPKTLAAELSAAGFVNITQAPAQYKVPVRDMRIVGTKA